MNSHEWLEDRFAVFGRNADPVIGNPDHPLVGRCRLRGHVNDRSSLAAEAQPREGRRRYTGKLLSADEQQIEMQVDGVAVQIAYGDVDRARLVPQWPDTTRKR